MNLVIILEFNKDKIFEQNEFSKFVMQASHTRGDLVDTVKIILEFNEAIQLNLT